MLTKAIQTWTDYHAPISPKRCLSRLPGSSLHDTGRERKVKSTQPGALLLPSSQNPQARGVLRVRQEPLEQGLGPPSGGLWGCDQLKPLQMVTKCLHILLSLSLGARCLSPCLCFSTSTSVSCLQPSLRENTKRPNYSSHKTLTKPKPRPQGEGTKQTQGTVIMVGKGIQYYGMFPGRCQESGLAVSQGE